MRIAVLKRDRVFGRKMRVPWAKTRVSGIKKVRSRGRRRG